MALLRVRRLCTVFPSTNVRNFILKIDTFRLKYVPRKCLNLDAHFRSKKYHCLISFWHPGEPFWSQKCSKRGVFFLCLFRFWPMCDGRPLGAQSGPKGPPRVAQGPQKAPQGRPRDPQKAPRGCPRDPKGTPYDPFCDSLLLSCCFWLMGCCFWLLDCWFWLMD